MTASPRRARLTLAFVTVALILSVVAATSIGSAVSIDTASAVLARRLGLESVFGNFDVTWVEDQIVWQLRLPRVLGAFAVGAMLAVCGALLQTLTRNDLADPYLFGLSGGAAAGAATIIVFGVGIVGATGPTAVSVAAFIGAAIALGLVIALSYRSVDGISPNRTVLAGIAVTLTASSYTAFIISVFGTHDTARRVMFWTFGSIAGVRWSSATVLLITLAVGAAVAGMLAHRLDAMAFGDTSATALGISVGRLRWGLLAATAAMTAVAVAYCGVIGFVGLVVPHMVRLTLGPGHRNLLAVSALLGGLLMLWTDTLARTVADTEVPVGVITAIVGAPAFALLLRRARG